MHTITAAFRVKLASSCFLLLGVVIPLRASAAEEQPVILLTKEVAISVLNAADRDELRHKLKDWRSAPVYQRLSVIEALLDQVAKRQAEGEAKNTAKLTLMSKLAEALNVMLSVTNQQMGVEDGKLALTLQSAKLVVAGYRAAAIELSPAVRPEALQEELIARYKGRIITGRSEKAQASAEAMAELFLLYPPLGRRIEFFTPILGNLGQKAGDDVVYRFDSGFSGYEFRISAVNGTITNVSISGID